MEKGDGGEEELENIEEIITDDDKVGDAGTTSVAKHQTGNKGTSDITENSLNIRTTQKKKITAPISFYVYLLVILTLLVIMI